MKNLVVDKKLQSQITRNMPSPKDDEILDAMMRNIQMGLERKKDENGELVYKPCTYCQRKGRMYIRHKTEFSILKDGRLHSQCRPCRTEQSGEWTTKKKIHRKEYQKEYRKGYTVPDNPKKRMPVIRDIEDTELFVAILK